MKTCIYLTSLLFTIVLLTCSPGSKPVCAVETASGEISIGGTDAVPKFDLKKIEGGTFQMGAHENQSDDADDDEFPLHRVTISQFYLCSTEVTQELWKWAMSGKNPSEHIGTRKPVDNVSYDDCTDFIRRLNRRVTELGLPRTAKFRLPTEAEWEYAARGGNKSRGYRFSGSSSIDDIAWHNNNSDNTTHNVGMKKANELGLFDMSGNVNEWCADCFKDYPSAAQTNPHPTGETAYNMRGGAYNYKSKSLRTSYRNHASTEKRYENTGLRLALDLR